MILLLEIKIWEVYATIEGRTYSRKQLKEEFTCTSSRGKTFRCGRQELYDWRWCSCKYSDTQVNEDWIEWGIVRIMNIFFSKCKDNFKWSSSRELVENPIDVVEWFSSIVGHLLMSIQWLSLEGCYMCDVSKQIMKFVCTLNPISGLPYILLKISYGCNSLRLV